MTSTHDTTLTDLLDRPIAFQRAFVRLGFGAGGALFLSYLAERGCARADTAITQEEIERETGLTRREQDTIRKHLRSAYLLSEYRRGIPSCLYFRINAEAISKALGAPI